MHEIIVFLLLENYISIIRKYDILIVDLYLQEEPDIDAINQCKYLEMVLNETTRMYPVAPG